MWNNYSQDCSSNDAENVEMLSADENDSDDNQEPLVVRKPFYMRNKFIQITRQNGKIGVKCQYCNIELANRTPIRLRVHRLKCPKEIQISEESQSLGATKKIIDKFSDMLQFDKFKKANNQYFVRCRKCKTCLRTTASARLLSHRQRCALPKSVLSNKTLKALIEEGTTCRKYNRLNETVLNEDDMELELLKSQCSELGFVTLNTGDSSTDLQCLRCQLVLSTSDSRSNDDLKKQMENHREKCLYIQDESSSNITQEQNINSTTSVDYIFNSSDVKQEISIVDVLNGQNESFLISTFADEPTAIPQTKTLNTCTSNRQPLRRSARQTATTQQSSINSSESSTHQVQKADLLLAKFLGCCDIPLDVVDSEHFKSFLKEINSSYVIPSRDILSQYLEVNKISLNKDPLQNWVQTVNGNSLCENNSFNKITCKLTKEMYENEKLSNRHLWHALCLSHTEYTFVQDLIKENCEFMETIIDTMVQMEFVGRNETNYFEKDNWCSYRGIVKCFLENQPTNELFNSIENHEKVERLLKIFDLISTLIGRSQDDKFTIADLTQELLSVKETNNKNNSIIDKFIVNQSINELNDIALCANYLHPSYQGSLLSNQQKETVDNYLLNKLDANGLDSLIQFNENIGLFGKLSQKNIKSIDTFWYFVKRDHGNLYQLAVKVLKTPAKSYLEQMFMNYSLVRN